MDGAARKLDVNASRWLAFHVSPGDRQIAFTAQAGESGHQVWAIENVLPRH